MFFGIEGYVIPGQPIEYSFGLLIVVGLFLFWGAMRRHG